LYMMGKISTKSTPQQSVWFDLLQYHHVKTNPKKVMQDYAQFHRKVMEGNLPPRYLVVITSPGVGMGNRFEQILYSFLVAVVTGRAFLIQWEGKFNLSLILNRTANIHWDFNSVDLRAFTKGKSARVYHSYTTKGQLELQYALENESNQQSKDLFGPTYEVVVINKPNVIKYPVQTLYDHPSYRHVIPHVFPEWKETLTNFLFVPTDEVLQHVEKLKQKMQPYDFLTAVQLRTTFYENNPTQSDRIFECAKYWTTIQTRAKNSKYFITTDDIHLREYAKNFFGEDKVFYSDIPPVHTSVGGDVEFNFSGRPEHFKNVMVDWYMIGEADMKIFTSASSFAFTAAHRTSSPRFPVGGRTTCSNPNDQHYLEKIYWSMTELYSVHNKLVHIDLQ